MTATTDRLILPLIAPGQAQKEMTHNEALTLIDALVQPVVQTVGTTAPPANPLPGQCWIIGTSATGDWAGHAAALAISTSGGWRFVSAFEGMSAWSLADGMVAVHRSGVWLIGETNARKLSINGIQVVAGQQATIAAPAGGMLADAESRAAIAAILMALREHGLIAR